MADLNSYEYKTRALFRAMMSGENLEEAFDELWTEAHTLLPEEITLENNMEVLLLIGQFLNIESAPVVMRQNGTQKLVSSKIGDLFWNEFDESHIHTDGDYSCGYHEESLFSHLVMAMLIAINGSKKDDEHTQFLCGLTALLHDVGKKAVVSHHEWIQAETKNKIRATGFPFHGEMGALVLQGLYNPTTFDQFVTRKEWEDICRVLAVHMCGYHDTTPQDPYTQVKWNQLRLENDQVKQILIHLSVADTYAAFPHPGFTKPPFREHLVVQKELMASLGQDYDHDVFKQISQSHGTLISMLGTSGSGKSTMIRNLINFLCTIGISKDRIRVVDRDTIMVEQVAIVEGWEAPQERPTGEMYTLFYAKYKENKLGSKVNQVMKQRIAEGLRNGDVVIVDTVATLFGDFVLPGGPIAGGDNELLVNAIKISIYMNRSSLATDIDGEKNGHTLKSQLEIMGECSLVNRLPLGIRKPGQMKCLESLMTSRRMQTDLQDWRKRTRPHLVFPVTWSDAIQLGHSHLEDHLIKLAPHLVSNIKTGEKDRMNIGELMTELWSEFEENVDKISDWFHARGFVLKTLLKNTDVAGTLFLISYRDGLCFEWSERWCRECRGVVIWMDGDQARVMSRKLQRGAEVLTGTHLRQGVEETQELGAKRHHRFDQCQKYTMDALREENEIHGFLTSKVDGSLLAVNMYRQGSPLALFVTKLIENYADPFTKAVANACRDSRYLIVLSTQNTFFHADIMHAYNTTALGVGLGIYTHEQMVELAKTKKPCEVIAEIIAVLNARVNAFVDNLPTLEGSMSQIDVMTLSFETICAYRTSAWGDKHTELAISYPNSDFYFLGTTCGLDGSSGSYLPHFATSTAVQAANFSEPLWWKVDSGKKVSGMLNMLDGILTSIHTEEEFMKLYPPTGGTVGRWDFEGFVFFTMSDGIEGATEKYDYSKVKTPTYYICHKLRDEHILKLSQLPPETQQRFPLAYDVGAFFNNLDERLTRSVRALVADLQEAAQKSHHPLHDRLSKGPRKGFARGSQEVKMRILVATIEGELVYPYFAKEFSDLPSSSEQTLRKLIMELKPWGSDYAEAIRKLVANRDPTVRKMFKEIRERPI